MTDRDLIIYITRMARREIQKSRKTSFHELVMAVYHRAKNKEIPRTTDKDKIKDIIETNLMRIAIDGISFSSNEFTNTRYEE